MEKTFTLKNGDTIVVRELLPARLADAGRALQRAGVKVNATDANLADSVEMQSELARTCLVSWTRPDGSDPLAGLAALSQRRVLAESPITGIILKLAQQLADEQAGDYEVVSGN